MLKRIIYLVFLISLSLLLIESIRYKIADKIIYPLVHGIGVQNNYADAIIWGGNIKRYVKKFDDAKKDYIYVIKKEDLSKQKNALEMAYLNLGHTFYKIGDYSNAAKAYYLTLKKNPGNKDALLPFVRINMAYENSSQIIPIVQSFISTDIKDSIGFTELCALYNRLEEFDVARVNCQNAIKNDKNYARAHYDYGVALLSLGFNKDSEKEFKLAKKLQPNIKSREKLEEIMLSVKKDKEN